MITNYNVHAGIILKKSRPHSHEADEFKIQVQQVVRTIKRKQLTQSQLTPKPQRCIHQKPLRQFGQL